VKKNYCRAWGTVMRIMRHFSFEIRYCHLLLATITFFCVFTVSATEGHIIPYVSDTKEETDLRWKLPADVWKHIVSFLTKKESYVLGQLDQNPEVRNFFLVSTDTIDSFEEIKKIFDSHRRKNQAIEDRLWRKEVFFCFKHSCLPFLYVMEIGATKLTWATIGVLALYVEAIRGVAILVTTCTHCTADLITCSSYNEESSRVFVEDACACLFCKDDEFTLYRCLWIKDFWQVKKPEERQELDSQQLNYLRQKLRVPPAISPEKQEIQRD
jgi:hypothetical protein